MIAVASSGKRFGALAAYLTREREGVPRVGWVETRNLPTDDPRLAARFMQATAAFNARVQAPVYHVAVSFHPDDVVTREMMVRVADRLLAELQLTEHQVVIVAHTDRDHPHMHLMVNRVHPETGRAWDRWQDRVTTQRVLREEERVLGLREVRGRLHQLPDQEARARTAHTSGEHRMAVRSGVEPLIDLARAYTPELRAARSWGELHDVLKARGLTLERKGQGLIITDGHEQVKASRVHRDLSFAHLQRRLGPFQERTAATTIVADRILPIAEEVRRAAYHDRLGHIDVRASHDQYHYASALRNLEWARDRARALGHQFDRALSSIYTRPEDSRALFDQAVRLNGRGTAVRALLDRPEAFGTMRTSEHTKWLGFVIVVDHREALAKLPEAARLGAEAAKAADHLRATIRELIPPRVAGDLHKAEAYVNAVTHLTTRLRHAERRSSWVRAAARGAPDRRSQGRNVMALMPAELRRLALLLTDPERAIMYAALGLARDVVLGRGR